MKFSHLTGIICNHFGSLHLYILFYIHFQLNMLSAEQSLIIIINYN